MKQKKTLAEQVEIDLIEPETPKYIVPEFEKENKPEFLDTTNKIVVEAEIQPTEKLFDEIREEQTNESENLINYKLSTRPILSLKKSISINDKFMITSDLFDGSGKTYNKVIQSLDELENQEQALSLFDQLTEEYEWKIKDPTFKQFKSYVERRYL